jgi:hypothetical protein
MRFPTKFEGVRGGLSDNFEWPLIKSSFSITATILVPGIKVASEVFFLKFSSVATNDLPFAVYPSFLLLRELIVVAVTLIYYFGHLLSFYPDPPPSLLMIPLLSPDLPVVPPK